MPQLDIFSILIQTSFTFLSFYISLIYIRLIFIPEIYANIKLTHYMIIYFIKFAKLFFFKILNKINKYISFINICNLKKSNILNNIKYEILFLLLFNRF